MGLVPRHQPSSTPIYNYNESGQLIGEYDGNAIREYIYLGGQPIALMSNEKEGEILQVHTDHLGTPRAVSNTSNEILWRMEGDQFGDVQPQVATITMPLRHAGQYADDESGLFYNYFRYYNPATGRYLRSDPIGLEGGLNTFGYVGGSPLLGVDPLGLFPSQGAYGRGERGASGGSSGKNSKRPNKKCREYNPPQRKSVQCRHHQTGKWVKMPRPIDMPFPEDDNSTQMCNEECTDTAVVVAGGMVGGYVLYRCGRMVPSLAPPLWWTIPANVVTP